MFNYGGIRKFFIKIVFGAFFLFLSAFAFLSLFTHDINDPGIFVSSTTAETLNFFGFYGAYFSSILIIFFGLPSYLLAAFCAYHSIKSILGISSNYLTIKTLVILITVILINFNLTLVDIGYDGSLIGRALKDVLSFSLLPIDSLNTVIKIIVFTIIIVFSFLLLIFCFEIKFKKIKFLNNFSYIIISFLKQCLFLLSFSWLIKLLINNRDLSKFKTKKRKSEPTISKNSFEQKQNNLEQTYKSKKLNESSLSYELPPLSLLKTGNKKISSLKEAEKNNSNVAKKLEQVLLEFGVEGKIINFESGPVVTLFEFVPAPGIKNSKIISLSNDIARSMSSLTARISSQPGKTSIGIEIPNEKKESVYFGDIIKETNLTGNEKIELALGKDIAGLNVFADLKKMPHLLIAGTTGSGKSVGINCMIMSILYTFKPSECKLILIDPKMLELSIYEDIPHLLTPVVTNPNKAIFALKWVVREMENRYQIMSSINVKNIDSFNNKIRNSIDSGRKLFREVQTGIDKESRKPIIERREIPLEIMPLIVVVVDEMADLMMVAGKEVENLIQRLAQMARASGIHLITATQRPSVDVITGTIKANFPSRISYRVASKFDSRTILNEMGAEQLLGSGDMLFLENGAYLKRLHGGFVSENEIESVVQFIKQQSKIEAKQDITADTDDKNNFLDLDFEESGVDELYSKAVDIVIQNQKVSTSFIQRYLQIGYNRAARIVEKMEEDGIVSTSNNAGKRSVLKEK